MLWQRVDLHESLNASQPPGIQKWPLNVRLYVNLHSQDSEADLDRAFRYPSEDEENEPAAYREEDEMKRTSINDPTKE